jgi:hypothetical protein
MPKKLISLLLLLPTLFLCSCLSTEVTGAAVNSAAIEVSGEHRYKALRLEPPIYSAANSDLSDLRIISSTGENTPYFIHSGWEKTTIERETYTLALINSYVKDEHFYFDYTLAQAREGDTIATSLDFSTNNNNFAKTVNVYGSYDNINWQFIQSDKLYSIDDAVKLHIDFAQPQKYTHYRLQLANNLEKIAFSTALLVYSAETAVENYFIESLEPSYSVEEQDKTTRIIISGLKNLRLCDITLQTDSLFKRTVTTPGGIRKELYNLSLNEVYLADLSMQLDGRITPDDTYTVTIANADDKPINIDAIIVRYYADELVFEAKAGEAYRLEFGADAAKTAPVYDIARYRSEILKGELDHTGIGEIIYAEAPQERDYKPIFNIVVIAIALLLGAVILLRLRKPPSAH